MTIREWTRSLSECAVQTFVGERPSASTLIMASARWPAATGSRWFTKNSAPSGIGAVIGKGHKNKTVVALSCSAGSGRAQEEVKRHSSCPAGAARTNCGHNARPQSPYRLLFGSQAADNVGRINAIHFLLDQGVSIAAGLLNSSFSFDGAGCIGLWNASSCVPGPRLFPQG